jgi:molybdopterin-guanine dinucleotide biosynthesis protein A
MVSKDELTLAILCGGRARRLGGIDKGALICEGRALIDRLRDLGALCSATIEIREDVVPGHGAPGGVVTALLQAKTPWVLVVCCDMPHVPARAAIELATHAGKDVTLFDDQPFPALYRSSLAAPWRALLERNPSMSELLGGVERVQLPCSDPRWVRSVNTPEDARALDVEIPRGLC